MKEVLEQRYPTWPSPGGRLLYAKLIGGRVVIRLGDGCSPLLKGVLLDVAPLRNHPETLDVGQLVLHMDDGSDVIVRGSYILSIGASKKESK